MNDLTYISRDHGLCGLLPLTSTLFNENEMESEPSLINALHEH